MAEQIRKKGNSRRKLRRGYRLRLIVLCVALLALTAFLIPTGISFAKYVYDMYDYTGAVASDFHFTSNYLDSTSVAKTYTINSWDGGKYDFEFEVRNYDNSLRFNEEGLDLWYYVEVDVQYLDGTAWKDKDSDYTIEYSLKDDEAKNDVDTWTYCREIDTLVDGVTETTRYLFPSAQLKGSKTFDRSTGTHKLTVTLKFKEDIKQNYDHKLIISLKTVTASEVARLRKVAYSNDLGSEQFADGAYAATVTDYSAKGVYDSELACEVILSRKSVAQTVTASWKRLSNISTELQYNLTCGASTVSGTSNVRVYFNSKRVTANENLLSSSIGRSEFSKAKNSSGAYLNDSNTDVRYVDITVQSSCTTHMSFFTSWAGSEDTDSGTNCLVIPADGDATICKNWTSGTAVPDIWFEILEDGAEVESFTADTEVNTAETETMPTQLSENQEDSTGSSSTADTPQP